MDPAEALLSALNHAPQGVCGHLEPAQAITTLPDVETRLRALALGAALDVFPRSDRWERIGRLQSHWLLDVSDVAYKTSHEVLAAMQDEHLGGPRYNARVWWQICRGVQGRFKGSVRDLLHAGHDDASVIQTYLANSRATFPVLSGPVIAPQWLDMVHRLGKIPLLHWADLRVKLTSSQQKSACLFGITETQTHPQIKTALQIWRRSCRKLSADECGLPDCPLHQ